MQILYFPIPSTTRRRILGDVEVGVLQGMQVWCSLLLCFHCWQQNPEGQFLAGRFPLAPVRILCFAFESLEGSDGDIWEDVAGVWGTRLKEYARNVWKTPGNLTFHTAVR